jgi:putative tRNA adenosine deaminase-associated protein
VLGMVSMDDDFFVLVRKLGTQVRVLLSDVTAANDWPLAGGVADLVDMADSDDDDPRPVGDLDSISDLGRAALELGVLCDDDDLYPDEILGDVATRLGFGDAFERIVG